MQLNVFLLLISLITGVLNQETIRVGEKYFSFPTQATELLWRRRTLRRGGGQEERDLINRRSCSCPFPLLTYLSLWHHLSIWEVQGFLNSLKWVLCMPEGSMWHSPIWHVSCHLAATCVATQDPCHSSSVQSIRLQVPTAPCWLLSLLPWQMSGWETLWGPNICYYQPGIDSNPPLRAKYNNIEYVCLLVYNHFPPLPQSQFLP